MTLERNHRVYWPKTGQFGTIVAKAEDVKGIGPGWVLVEWDPVPDKWVSEKELVEEL